MIRQTHHITATSSISNNAVTKNGQLLFVHDEPNMVAFFQAIYKHFAFNYSRFYKMDSLSKLGWLSTEILLKDSFKTRENKPEQTALVFSNANGSLESDLRYMASVHDIPSPALFVYTLPNIMLGEISIKNGFKGETAFFISEQFDAVFIEQYVNNLFLTSDLKSCICGWVDVLDNQYKSVLFLVQRGEGNNSFNGINMMKVYNEA